MKCDNCGTAVPQGAGFCPVCGKRIPGYTTLVSKARQGDQQALTELYCRTSDGVYNTIRFLIKEEDTAQDVLQGAGLESGVRAQELDVNAFHALYDAYRKRNG